MDDLLTFPENFMCIGLKTFKFVFEHRKEWVDFTLTDMENPKGLFLKWKQYCQHKLNKNESSPKNNSRDCKMHALKY